MNCAKAAGCWGTLCLTLCVVPVSCGALLAEGPSIAEVVQDILHDQPAIVTSPLRADGQDAVVWVPSAMLATGLAIRWNTRMSLDERVGSHYADTSGTTKSAMKGLTQLGNGAVPFGLSVFGYGVGRWGGHDQLQSFSAHWFEALADVSLWGEIIKVTAGRARPQSAPPFRSDFLGPSGYFRNSGQNSSFVSGHTTVSFVSAAVISREFPTPWVVVPAYLVAGGVGFSRIYLDQHWMSDVVMGAVLGQSIGTLVENRHQKVNPSAGAWQPWVHGDSVGVVWTRKF